MSNAAKYADVYLDYAAGTPVDAQVLRTMLPYFGHAYRNPSSMHAGGRRARSAIEKSRAGIARAINADETEIVFTSSGTESDNLAIVGAARAYRTEGNQVIISAVEHKAALEAANALAKEGFEVTMIPVDRYGRVDVDTLLAQVSKRTILVSIIYANNELGTINPIKELSAALQTRRGQGRVPLLHSDACQAFGFLNINVRELGVDLMTFNSAKLYGPTGVAALYVRQGVQLTPLIRGGEQERLLRSGTEPTPLIVGFAKTVEIVQARKAEEATRLGALRAYFVAELPKKIPGLIINGHPLEVLPNIVHVTVPGIEGEAMLLMLDEAGVSVSTGSACSAFDLRPSHVLSAIGQDSDLIHGSIRFSFGRDTTKEELDYALSVFPEIVSKLRSISSVTTQAYEMLHR